MILNHKQLEKLKANWGEKADGMECKAEVRVYDPLSKIEFYIYALNPDNDDDIMFLGVSDNLELGQWSMQSLKSFYNAHGEPLTVDQEYRPRYINEIFKKLMRNNYEYRN